MDLLHFEGNYRGKLLDILKTFSSLILDLTFFFYMESLKTGSKSYYEEVNPYHEGCTIHEESIQAINNYFKDLTSWVVRFFPLGNS